MIKLLDINKHFCSCRLSCTYNVFTFQCSPWAYASLGTFNKKTRFSKNVKQCALVCTALTELVGIYKDCIDEPARSFNMIKKYVLTDCFVQLSLSLAPLGNQAKIYRNTSNNHVYRNALREYNSWLNTSRTLNQIFFFCQIITTIRKGHFNFPQYLKSA